MNYYRQISKGYNYIVQLIYFKIVLEVALEGF